MRWCVLVDAQGSPISAGVLAVHAALLPSGFSGRIVYFGGSSHSAYWSDRDNQGDHLYVDNTERFSPQWFTIKQLLSPHFDVFCSGHAMMPNGSLLVAGGTAYYPGAPGNPFNDVEGSNNHHDHFVGTTQVTILSPDGVWTKAKPMLPGPNQGEGSGGRWYPTLITLPDGNVLAMTGHPFVGDDRHNNNTPEIYLTQTNKWMHLPLGFNEAFETHDEAIGYPRLHVMNSGEVFCWSNLQGTSSGTHALNTTTGVRRRISDFPPDAIYSDKSYTYNFSSVILPMYHTNNYRQSMLIVGGHHAYTIEPLLTNPQWVETPPRNVTSKRRHGIAVLLPTGEVFVCGGVGASGRDSEAVLQPEVYRAAGSPLFRFGPAEWDPVQWHGLPAATVPRNYHSVAVLMPDGRIWTAGSNYDGARTSPELEFDKPAPPIHRDDGTYPFNDNNMELRIEIFEPWYYSKQRPRIEAWPNAVEYFSFFKVKLGPREATTTAAVAVLRLGAVTHAFCTDQRYLTLNFAKLDEETIYVLSPWEKCLAPPGYYLLFVIDNEGVPSVGRFIRLGDFPRITHSLGSGELDRQAAPNKDDSFTGGRGQPGAVVTEPPSSLNEAKAPSQVAEVVFQTFGPLMTEIGPLSPLLGAGVPSRPSMDAPILNVLPGEDVQILTSDAHCFVVKSRSEVPGPKLHHVPYRLDPNPAPTFEMLSALSGSAAPEARVGSRIASAAMPAATPFHGNKPSDDDVEVRTPRHAAGDLASEHGIAFPVNPKRR